MALQTDIGSRIPEGAIRLSRNEALSHQQSIIRDWPSELEVSFLRYGNYIAGISNTITSGIIVNYFKNYLRIPARAYVLTIMPAIGVPGFAGYMLTDRILTENTLLMKMECPICYQMKFAFSQFYMGIGFPAIYSFASFAGVALVMKSYPLPSINTHAREFWKVSFGIFKEGASKFHVTGLIQTLVVLFLPYLQNKELVTVMSKLQEKERAMQKNT